MIGVIADDLTGAAELGAVGLRLGLKGWKILRGGKPGSGGARSWSARTRIRAHARRWKRRNARRQRQNFCIPRAPNGFIKKVDSVLRGNVTAEVEAVMQQLNFNRALILPANPSLGRIHSRR